MTQSLQRLELVVADLNVDGGAVARHEGRVVFLDRGLPGEKVLAEVTGEKKRVLLARVVESLSPSPDAVESFCSHFGTCGGCSMQNYAYPAQLELKRKQAAQVFSRIGGIDLAAVPGLCPEGESLPGIIPSPEQRGFRNKMEYAFGEAGGAVSVGLRRRASHEVLDIEGCPLQGPAAGAVLGAVRSWANQHGLSVWKEEPARRGASGKDSSNAADRAVGRGNTEQDDNVTGQGADVAGMSAHAGDSGTGDAVRRDGCLRYLVLRQPEYIREGQAQLVVELICGTHLPEKNLVEELWEALSACGVSSFVLSQRRARLGVARGERTFRVFGNRSIWEDFGGLLLEFPVSGFSQTNTGAATLLYKEAARFAAGDGVGPAGAAGDAGSGKLYSELWDLYSGVGALALGMSNLAGKTLGVELDEKAVKLANVNAARLGKGSCRFVDGDAAAFMESLHWRESRPRLLPQGFSGPDLLVADPPRSGMSPRILKSIKQCRPRSIVYVSCDPATQARDIAGLSDCYKLESLTLVDMFPHTPHVECVCRLTLRG
ncbi:class I SAM-dependent RNA methyltransferase [Desulfovibrio sp. OttesenSCG-928-C06]|nr:class I SAM-dependent RNA methyltransferase [Desulfovibrio sp. OttesenSCG-928-C06]